MHDVADAGVAGVVGTGLVGLAEFRRRLYGCFGLWSDALFELTDALAGAAGPIRSVAELMFEPPARRGWGSLYQALEHGTLDLDAARDLLAAQLPRNGPLLFAIDASKFARPDTRVVPDVGMQWCAGRRMAVPGWSMQWLVRVGDGVGDGGSLSAPKTSWAPPMDVRRVPTGGSGNEIAALQIADLVARLARRGAAASPAVPLFLLDVGYCPIYLTQNLPAGAQILVRLRGDRVFFGRPPVHSPAAAGRPRKHGDRFALDEPDTWADADAEHTKTHPDGTIVRVRAWHDKHPEPRARRKWAGTDVVEGTLIRRETLFAGGHTQVWWLWWAGPPDAFDLELVGDAYRHRFTCEHGFRFAKQDLFWTGHTPIDPDQAQRWSWLVALAYTQLHLARPHAVDRRLPWEKPCRPEQLTPRRVRRVFRQVSADLGTPARSPKPSRPGPGRPKGSRNKHARPRQPVIKKGKPVNTGHPKGRSPLAKAKPPP